MNIFMFWINENGGKTVTSLILGALTWLRDWRMAKCLEVHLRFSHFITCNSLKTFTISRLNVFEIDELWSWCLKGWWNQVAIRPKEGDIYGNPVNGNNQKIVCEQALGEIWLGRHQFSLHTAKIFSELSQVSRFEGYSHQSRDHTEGVGGTTYLDLLQVDLLASGASLVWPRSGRPRATKSRAIWNPTKDFFEGLLRTKCGTSRGGRGNGGSFENFEVKWRYSQTNKQVNACASQKG